MSKKIEEVFNMASPETPAQTTAEETGFDLESMQQALDTADKIDQALPAVRDLESLDKDMDEYAQQAMDAFKDLMDLGQNVEDRHAAPVFDSASKMMTNAITAKTAKMDKKLKMIEMQMRKRKLDLEEKKVEMQIAKLNDTPIDGGPIEGAAEEFDRSSLINDIMAKVAESKNGDK
jgi:hypothetical protein|tara:strand:- start:2840 stop:3367 length:528 start_codon:yes stop_codon:yes gene_type:complete